MPQFTRYTLNDEVPAVAYGWLYVQYNGEKNKIVDNLGNSMPPYSRAVVDGSDSTVASYVANGTLVVLSEGNTPLEEIDRVIVEEPPTNAPLVALAEKLSQSTPVESIEPEPPTEEMLEKIAAKEEAIKKSRKKKTVEPQAESTEISNEAETDVSNSEEQPVETSTSNEEPSV